MSAISAICLLAVKYKKTTEGKERTTRLEISEDKVEIEDDRTTQRISAH